MEEYITKEQAIAAMEQVTRPECFIEDTRKNFVKIIEELPAADVEEVVQCKDCEYLTKDKMVLLIGAMPETVLICQRTKRMVSEGFFCADGWRVDGED